MALQVGGLNARILRGSKNNPNGEEPWLGSQSARSQTPTREMK